MLIPAGALNYQLLYKPISLSNHIQSQQTTRPSIAKHHTYHESTLVYYSML